MRPILLASLLPWLLCACGDPPASAVQPAIQIHASTDWPLPTGAVASAQPDLVATADGRLLLSWLEADGKKAHALKFARFDGKRWGAPQQIARGGNWFVNWADTPHLLATEDGALWAHWLRKSVDVAYAYDVVLSRSADNGATWSPAIVVNGDDTPTEHGFVSLWPHSYDMLGIAWLDGRNMAMGASASHDGHGAGAMSLRVASIDPLLQKSSELELDPRTCDCCQTDAALTERGPLLVYRDRDGDEVRDIVTTRFDNGAWTLPRKVHDDRWKMPACPVNGPALAVRGNDAWVAWYTASGEVPRLRLAHSSDAGDVFSAPVEVDSGLHVQGRVGVAVDGDAVWVHWTREDAKGQSLWLARYHQGLGKPLQVLQVARLQGRGRATGFPKMVVQDGIGHLVWTDVVDGKPRLLGARVSPSTATPAR